MPSKRLSMVFKRPFEILSKAFSIPFEGFSKAIEIFIRAFWTPFEGLWVSLQRRLKGFFKFFWRHFQGLFKGFWKGLWTGLWKPFEGIFEGVSLSLLPALKGPRGQYLFKRLCLKQGWKTADFCEFCHGWAPKGLQPFKPCFWALGYHTETSASTKMESFEGV